MPALNRRDFLRTGALAAGLGSIARLRPLPVQAALPAAGLQVLDADQADLLAAIAERMVFSGDPAMPAVRATGAIAVVDRSLQYVDDGLRQQVGWLLWLFDWGPPLFDLRFARFRSLAPEAQDAYIRGWAESRFALRRLGFRALKNLAMLGYYTQDATWGGIGYDGPWIKAAAAPEGKA